MIDIHAVTALRLGESEFPTHVMWGLLHRPSGVWTMPPHIGDVAEVLAALRNDEDVFAVFGDAEHVVVGSRLRIGVDSNGAEQLVSLAENPGLASRKLPLF